MFPRARCSAFANASIERPSTVPGARTILNASRIPTLISIFQGSKSSLACARAIDRHPDRNLSGHSSRSADQPEVSPASAAGGPPSATSQRAPLSKRRHFCRLVNVARVLPQHLGVPSAHVWWIGASRSAAPRALPPFAIARVGSAIAPAEHARRPCSEIHSAPYRSQ